ncbi:hypothetical protein Tco_1100523 [Tanacetum coccineum]
MDLCRPMRVASVNGKKYILDDYSRFTWVKCLRSKDKASDFIVGIKRLYDDLEVTAAKVCVTAAKLNTVSVKLVLLVKIEENILSSYYCLLRVNVAGTKLQLLKVTTDESYNC